MSAPPTLKRFGVLGVLSGSFFAVDAMTPAASDTQDMRAAAGDYYEEAVAIDVREPRYPNIAARQLKEGWAIASFCVNLEGAVSEVEIIDSSDRVFEAPTKNAISEWTFEPAKLNGTQVESCEVEYQVTYILDMSQRKENVVGARKWFRKPYKKAVDLVMDNKWSEAQAIVQMIREDEKAPNMYELARLDLIEGEILFMLGRNEAALTALRGAVAGQAFVEEDANERAYEFLFMTQVNLELYGEAYRTFQTIETDYKDILKDPRVVQTGRELAKLSKASAAFATNARIAPDRTTVSHTLLRRKFGFSDISGQLETFKVFCDRDYFAAQVNTQESWTLPASWGGCSLTVSGAGGTSFKVTEY